MAFDFNVFGMSVLKIADGLKLLLDEAEKRDDAALKNVALKAKNELLELELAIESARRENEELRRKFETRFKVVFDPSVGVYYSVADRMEQGDRVILRDGPYCPACFDAQDKAVHVTVGKRGRGGALSIQSECPRCKAKFHSLYEDYVCSLPTDDPRLLFDPT